MFSKSHNEKGQGIIEYALILVLVAVVVIVIIALLGPAIGENLATLTGAATGTPVVTVTPGS